MAGHGVQAALLMAAARAFFRQRAAMAGTAAQVVGDVNCQIYRDVEETGRFITVFYLQVDRDESLVRWVRAGHDPALIYDPLKDRFEELGGKGPAFGHH